MTSSILTLNGGSSSLKFALFEAAQPLKLLYSGKIERIGSSNSSFEIIDHAKDTTEQMKVQATSHEAGLEPLLKALQARNDLAALSGIGHRVVHGGQRYRQPTLVDDEMMRYLEEITPYDPEHLPAEIAMIRAAANRFPHFRQIACFDTAFHRDLPLVAALLPIPRRYFEQGIQRYGFHGLSYSYLMKALSRAAGDQAANGRVILAHLGNGASMAAVFNGKSIDTSMAFTPTAGLVMGTRTGDLDPGIGVYLSKTEKMSPDQFYHMANFESGMQGVSETSSDMRDLLDHEAADLRAADAIRLFCYSARKMIGAYAAALGGLDTLIFSGGIGENAPTIRARICEGLDFLGILVDQQLNEANSALISGANSRIQVRVIHTDEEQEIAEIVKEFLT
jgi:acetate kinase